MLRVSKFLLKCLVITLILSLSFRMKSEYGNIKILLPGDKPHYIFKCEEYNVSYHLLFNQLIEFEDSDGNGYYSPRDKVITRLILSRYKWDKYSESTSNSVKLVLETTIARHGAQENKSAHIKFILNYSLIDNKVEKIYLIFNITGDFWENDDTYISLLSHIKVNNQTENSHIDSKKSNNSYVINVSPENNQTTFKMQIRDQASNISVFTFDNNTVQIISNVAQRVIYYFNITIGMKSASQPPVINIPRVIQSKLEVIVIYLCTAISSVVLVIYILYKKAFSTIYEKKHNM